MGGYDYTNDELYQPYLETIKQKRDELADQLLRKLEEAGLLEELIERDGEHLQKVLEQEGDQISDPRKLENYSGLTYILNGIQIIINKEINEILGSEDFRAKFEQGEYSETDMIDFLFSILTQKYEVELKSAIKSNSNWRGLLSNPSRYLSMSFPPQQHLNNRLPYSHVEGNG